MDANILALTTDEEKAFGKIFNVACGSRMTLNEIFKQIVDIIGEFDRTVSGIEPILKKRLGDVRHSLADISLAKKYLNYEPRLDTRRGCH